jgi:hypothetical protein
LDLTWLRFLDITVRAFDNFNYLWRKKERDKDKDD